MIDPSTFWRHRMECNPAVYPVCVILIPRRWILVAKSIEAKYVAGHIDKRECGRVVGGARHFGGQSSDIAPGAAIGGCDPPQPASFMAPRPLLRTWGVRGCLNALFFRQ
jgi:hypothetical protein